MVRRRLARLPADKLTDRERGGGDDGAASGAGQTAARGDGGGDDGAASIRGRVGAGGGVQRGGSWVQVVFEERE